MSTTYPSDLTDAEWACVQRYLPLLSGHGRPRIHPLRRILDAIFYVLCTGCAWRYLPVDAELHTLHSVVRSITRGDLRPGALSVCDIGALAHSLQHLASAGLLGA